MSCVPVPIHVIEVGERPIGLGWPGMECGCLSNVVFVMSVSQSVALQLVFLLD